MISLSRQIGLLGAFHSVSGTGLGAQPKKSFGAGRAAGVSAVCWAAAGVKASASAAKPRTILRDFIKFTPQTYVFAWLNNVPELAQIQPRWKEKMGVVWGVKFSPGDSG